MGKRFPVFSKASSIPQNAALAFNVSKIVSTNNISAPALMSAIACSSYISAKKSKSTSLYPGSFTLGEMDVVLFVGPIAPVSYTHLDVYKRQVKL